jgi:uncharacterized protein YkwD
MGAARVKSKEGAYFWCAVFGRPWSAIEPDEAREAMLTLVNRDRRSAHQPALRVNPKLEQIAQAYARDMAEQDTFKPKSDAGDTPAERLEHGGYRYEMVAAEAASATRSADATFHSWFDRPDHQKKLVGEYRELGIGYATTSKGVPYWVLLLAKPAR